MTSSLGWRLFKILKRARETSSGEYKYFKKRQLYAMLYGASLRRLHQMGKEFRQWEMDHGTA